MAAPCCPPSPLAAAKPTNQKKPSMALEFLTSSLGVATATTITQPIDLVKTRMQLELLGQQQGRAAAGGASSSAATPSGTGLFATAAGVVRREGVLALWGGAAPAAIRGMSYGGLRLGLYGPLRDALAAAHGAAAAGGGAASSPSSSSSSPNASFGIKLAAGAASGALAAAVTSPTELVKVRMQAAPAVAVAVAAPKKAAAAAPPAPNAPTPRPAHQHQHQPTPRPPVHHHHHHQLPAGLAGMSCSSAGGSSAASSSSSSSSAAGGSSGALRALSSSAAATTTPNNNTPPAREGGFSRVASIARQVVREDGVRGLWRGATPGMVRAAVLTASQCATYDAAKRRLKVVFGLPDESLALQTGCALLTGLASTTATQPVDVVKTHMFVTKRGGAGGGGGAVANGAIATARHIWAAHGARGFLRGWTASYARLGPMTVLIFTTTELLRRQLGMPSL